MLNFVFKFYRFLFARKIYYKLNLFLYTLSIRGLGILNYENEKISGEQEFIKKYVPKNKENVVFDVGANVGNYSKTIRKSSENACIYSFEPHPLTFRKLLENTKYLNIKVFNVGVGNKNGLLKLYDYADKDGSQHASLYSDVITKIHNGKLIEHEVEIIKLDDFVIKNEIEKIDLLKIDTEGNEFEVLKGFENFIRQGKIGIIHFEFNEMNTESRVFFKDFWYFLPNYNFYRMLQDGLVPIKKYSPVLCEVFAYQNIVAILKEIDKNG